METFQQIDGVYSDYYDIPTDACNRLFPGLD
jgi:hypothetical protein